MAIAETVPPGLRATANGLFISAALLGAGLAPLTLAPLLVHTGWRFETTVVGVTVSVKRVAITDANDVVAAWHRGRERPAIPIVALPLPDPPPAGWSGSKRTVAGRGDSRRFRTEPSIR